MNGVILLIFAIVAFNIFKSVVSAGDPSKKPKSVKRRKVPNATGRQNVWQIDKERARRQQSDKGFKENWQQAARSEARRRLADRADDLMTRRKDPADKNRNRTADWGSRAGPGLLNSKTVLILLAVLIIGIYLSSQTS